MTENTPVPEENAIYYIGSDDCKKATCNRRQEFPEAEDPYCVKHSLESFLSGEKA